MAAAVSIHPPAAESTFYQVPSKALKHDSLNMKHNPGSQLQPMYDFPHSYAFKLH